MAAKLCPLKFANPAALVPHLPTPDMSCEREKCEWFLREEFPELAHCAIVVVALAQRQDQR